MNETEHKKSGSLTINNKQKINDLKHLGVKLNVR